MKAWQENLEQTRALMNFTEFTEPQRQALLDLMVLGMYADSRLTSAEDERVHRLLATMGFESEYDRDKQLDASITRIRQHAQTLELARAHATLLSQNFTTSEQRREVYKLLDDLMASDNQIVPQESQILAVVKEVFEGKYS